MLHFNRLACIFEKESEELFWIEETFSQSEGLPYKQRQGKGSVIHEENDFIASTKRFINPQQTRIVGVTISFLRRQCRCCGNDSYNVTINSHHKSDLLKLY